GIRDFHVTGVQTCALPISAKCRLSTPAASRKRIPTSTLPRHVDYEIFLDRHSSILFFVVSVSLTGSLATRDSGQSCPNPCHLARQTSLREVPVFQSIYRRWAQVFSETYS